MISVALDFHYITSLFVDSFPADGEYHSRILFLKTSLKRGEAILQNYLLHLCHFSLLQSVAAAEDVEEIVVGVTRASESSSF